MLSGFAQEAIHDTSPQIWNGMGQDPWPHTEFTTVNENSCLNCHRSHSSGGGTWLLNAFEEDNCLTCHNGNVGSDINAELNKSSSHRVRFYQGHEPDENILSAPIHVECTDCHNPHQANANLAEAPFVQGPLTGVSGMTITGSLTDSTQYEYEVCLKCHGQNKYIVTTPINRMFDTSNIRLAFSPSNASYHAIAAPGTSNYVPSLLPPYNLSSQLYCTDCHNNDSSTGPRGPHGSSHEYLLELRYETGDFTPFSIDSYALCFKCHNPTTIMGQQTSGFKIHRRHIDYEVSCATCHDPHGSPNYIGLLNFNTNIVFPDQLGRLRFEIIGNKGYCYLSCHGVNHDPWFYVRR